LIIFKDIASYLFEAYYKLVGSSRIQNSTTQGLKLTAPGLKIILYTDFFLFLLQAVI
jgi:hypothetical protein